MTKADGASGASFCWHCSRQLMRKKDGFYFDLVVDPVGNVHRVHKDCADLVIGDGVKKCLTGSDTIAKKTVR